jgi:exopolyphosphatase/guanosine-5'-triphosphate,3'-diphosphate pyrophosphatase
MPNPNRRAVIDLGSNSALLVISELKTSEFNPEENQLESNQSGQKLAAWEPIYEESIITALGEGTKSTGLINEPGATNALKALDHYFKLAHQFDCQHIVAAATMAVRIASNAQEFLTRCQSQQTPVIVLSGEQEAELGFFSVVEDPIFSQHQRISIIDPGGHSTEIVTAQKNGENWEILYRNSFPIGTLAIRSQLLPSETNEGLNLLKATSSLDNTLGLCYLPGKCGEVIALGAAGTNLLSIRDAILEWDADRVHGQTLTYEEISKSVGWLMPLTDVARAAIPGLEKGREKTIHHGALILERCLFALRAEYCRLSVRGWRHALLNRIEQFI